MIFLGNQRSMDNFVKGTKEDIKDTYKLLVNDYKEVNDNNIDYIYDYVEQLHMLLLQYRNVKESLDNNDVACWTIEAWDEELNWKQRECLEKLLEEYR